MVNSHKPNKDKRMKKYLLLLLVISTFLGYSQDSFRKLTRNGERALKKGDFVTASIKGSQALLQKSNFKRSIALFENAIKVVYKSNQVKIDRIEAQAFPYKDFNSVGQIQQMIGLYKQLQQVRDAASIIGKVSFKTIKNPMDYGREYTLDIQNLEKRLGEYKVLAAEDFYVLGTNQFTVAKTKEQFLEASNNFKRIKDFVVGYKDALALEQESIGIYNQMSAEQLYNEGSDIYNSAGYKKDYQRAYYVFIQIEKFIPNFKNTNELIASCIDLGTYKVAFVPISKAERFAYELKQLYDQARGHARSLAFVEVVDINVDGVTNLEVLTRYLKSSSRTKGIDHLYKFTMDDFKVFFVNRRETVTQEKTKKIRKNKVETTISGSFTKVRVDSRAFANAYLEVVDFNTSNTLALVNLSDNIVESSQYWIFNEGNIDAFVNWKHTVPLVTDEDRIIQKNTNNAAFRIQDIMKMRITEKQLELYN